MATEGCLKFIKMDVPAGEHIAIACKNACKMANDTQKPVEFNFNELVLIARPGLDPKSLEDRYHNRWARPDPEESSQEDIAERIVTIMMM